MFSHRPGIPLALASSSSLAEIDAVVTARLGPTLRAIASGEEVPRHKPAPDVYLLAVERLAPARPACWPSRTRPPASPPRPPPGSAAWPCAHSRPGTMTSAAPG